MKEFSFCGLGSKHELFEENSVKKEKKTLQYFSNWDGLKTYIKKKLNSKISFYD